MSEIIPFEERSVDTQYKDRLKLILNEGIKTETTAQGVSCRTLIAPPPMRFNLLTGAPLITERKISFWKSCIGELLAFINGARTTEELEKFGCKWWENWATPEKCAKRGLEAGDLGPGSYGPAFHDFPTEDGFFNQFEMILQQIKNRPELRTHFITPWIPQYAIRIKGKQQKVVVCPCHGWVHLRILNCRLYLHMFQRSADFPIGVPANLIQYYALWLALIQITGYEPGEVIFSYSDAHIYEDQIPMVEEMLNREPKRLPDLIINPTVKDLFKFRPEHFSVENYHPHQAIGGIPVAI